MLGSDEELVVFEDAAESRQARVEVLLAAGAPAALRQGQQVHILLLAELRAALQRDLEDVVDLEVEELVVLACVVELRLAAQGHVGQALLDGQDVAAPAATTRQTLLTNIK